MVETETPPTGGGHGPLRIPTPIPARNSSSPNVKPGGNISSWNRNMLSSSTQHGQHLSDKPPGHLSKKPARGAFGGVGTVSCIPRPVHVSTSVMSSLKGGHTDCDVAGNRRFRRALSMNPRINGYPAASGPRLAFNQPGLQQSSQCGNYSQGDFDRSHFQVEGPPSLSARMSHLPRKRQQQHLSTESKQTVPEELPPPPLATMFHRILQDSPPSLPPGLVQRLERREAVSQGRVEVMLRICPTASEDVNSTAKVPFLDLDARRKQLTVYEPTAPTIGPAEERQLGITAPKMFAFDAIFSEEDPQTKVCSKALGDILPAVVSGSDACVFSYGYSKLGKSHTMIGASNCSQDWGIIPSAISWLFKLIHEQRQKTGARFSVRVSALAILGKSEIVKDLLSTYAKGTESHVFSPGMYLREDRGLGEHLQNQSELRAPSAEKAAFYLDAAIAASRSALKESDGIMHFVFTLHVYQYRVDKSGKGTGVAGGRSRLYLVDLGGCEKQSQVFSYSKSYRVSLANLGNVILAIFNSQKHVPYKDSKLTQLLRDILGNVTYRAAMIAHISSCPANYTDSLATMQLASRIHRLRHKKTKNIHQNSVGGSADDPLNRLHRRDGPRSSSSDVDCTSSSEQSCDTVIFVGPRERTLHEGVEVVPSVERKFGLINSSPAPLMAPIVKPSFAQIRRTSPTATESNSHRIVCGPGVGYHSGSPNGCQVETRLADSLAKQQFYLGMERKSPNNALPSVQPVEHKSNELRAGGRPWQRMISGEKSRDEVWVDGSRSTGPKFSNSVQKEWSLANCLSSSNALTPNTETWIDGPRATRHCDYFLDEQKRAMIERWIDLQTSSFLSSDTCEDALPSPDFFLEHDRTYRTSLEHDRLSGTGEAEIISNVDSFVSGDTEPEKNNAAAWSASHEDTVESINNMTDSQWNEHCKAMEFYRHVVRHIGETGEEGPVEQDEVTRENQCEMKNVNLGGTGENVVVPVIDSWVQVTELEIACECLSLADEANDEDDHPLRVLSSESLAISFADSSQMSWDSGLNAVRQAFAVTDQILNRSQVSVGVGTEEDQINVSNVKESDSRRCWSFENLSVHSDPGSGISVSGMCMSQFGSRSLESLDKQCTLSAQNCCNADCKRGHDGRPVCIQCNFDFLRRPDGSSNPRLEYRHSSEDLDSPETEDGNFKACEKTIKRDMFLDVKGVELQVDRNGSSPSKESYVSCQFESQSPPCPSHLGFNSWLADQSKMKDEKSHVKVSSGRIKQPGFKTTMTFCCAMGVTQKGGRGGCSSNSSSSSESPTRTAGGLISQVSSCRMLSGECNSDRPEVFHECDDDQAGSHKDSQIIIWPDSNKMQRKSLSKRSYCATVLTEPRCSRDRLPLSLPSPSSLHKSTEEDKSSYDSGTGSTNSSGGQEVSKKECRISPGTSSGYGSTPRGSEGSCSISIRDSASLSSDETPPPMVVSKILDHKSDGSKLLADKVKESRNCHLEIIKPDRLELREYEEADVERVERRRTLELSMKSRRQRAQILQLRQKREELKRELDLVNSLLMLNPDAWNNDYVDEEVASSDSELLETLKEETRILEERVNHCKSRIIMMTSFDITQPEPVSLEASTSLQSEVIVNQVATGCASALYQLENI